MIKAKSTKVKILILTVSVVILVLDYFSILRFIMAAGSAAGAGVSGILLIWSIPAVNRHVKLYLRKMLDRVKRVRHSRPETTN